MSPEGEKRLVKKQGRGARFVFFVLGWFFFVLGAVGVVLPVLPTTPFMILALGCFARSSEKFHRWLYGHSIFGPPLQRWEEHRVIPLGAKVFALTAMALSLIYVSLYVTVPSYVLIVMIAVMGYGAFFILGKPSNVPNRNDGS